MITYYIITLFCMLFQAERGVLDTIFFLSLFSKINKKTKNYPETKKIETQKRDLYILIPLLSEQKIIEETLLNFCQLKNDLFNIKIIPIVTKKEDHLKKLLTTEEIIMQSLYDGKLAKYKDNFIVLKDTNLQGSMATQLNFALREIASFTIKNSFYIIYNADSLISNNTLDGLASLLEKYPNHEFAFQQPCAYVKNLRQNSSNFSNALALYQSLYCLGHESRLVYKYGLKSEKYWGNKENRRLGVVVGHGSGMTLNIHKQNDGYPENLLTEDLTFGFILSANNIPILQLSGIEIADVPNSLFVFIKQKSVWFWNYFGYISCYKKMKKKGYNTFKLFVFLIQGMSAGAYWFFSAFFVALPLFFAIVFQNKLLIFLSLISTFCFCIIPQYILFKKIPGVLDNQGFSNIATNIRKTSFIKMLPSICLITVTDSVGPWIAFCRYIRYLFDGKLPKKYKTED